MSVAVPLFTYAASVNHKADHTIKETVLGNQATETPYNATAVPFSEADLVRVGELRCDKMRTREGGSAVPGRVRTQRLTVTNGAWDGSGYSTNQMAFNGAADGEGNAALYVQGGGANIVGGARVNGDATVTGTVTTNVVKANQHEFMTVYALGGNNSGTTLATYTGFNSIILNRLGASTIYNGRFTAKKAGIYLVAFSALTANSPVGNTAEAQLWKTGSWTGVRCFTELAGRHECIAFTIFIQLNVDDYLEMKLQNIWADSSMFFTVGLITATD